jgi:adhesin transport system outer membrane protein
MQWAKQGRFSSVFLVKDPVAFSENKDVASISCTSFKHLLAMNQASLHSAPLLPLPFGERLATLIMNRMVHSSFSLHPGHPMHVHAIRQLSQRYLTPCKKQWCWTGITASLLMALGSAACAAEAPAEIYRDLLSSSNRVTAAGRDVDGAISRRDELFRRAWTPNISFIAEAGPQRYGTDSVPGERRDAVRTMLRATQLLSDFGRSNSQVSEADAVIRQTGAVSGATRDGVLLEALTAHWSAVRSRAVLEYASKSEASVLNLTKVESSLVELGRGYESNVLQAKVQLAGAEARRVRSEGALAIADARVAAVFGPLASRVRYDQLAQAVAERVPATLEVARETALANNKQLHIGAYRSQVLSHRLASTHARETLPRLELVAESGRRSNWETTLDNSRVRDNKVMLQLSWNFNLGMAGSAARDAVDRDFEASVAREAETRDLVLEQVSISWRNLMVARQNRATLANQVRIAGKFFEMATAERQLGRRSLLDVLSAEVSLINAMSDLVSAEADGHIAALTLLQATGQLDMNAVQFVDRSALLPDIAALNAR